MPTDNPASRRDYRHFPAAYTDLLLKFDRDGSAALGPMAERDARAGLRDLYRFKTYLSAACDANMEDQHARQLMTIASRAIMRVEPTATADAPGGTHLIVITLNPIVAAMEATP